MARAHFVQKARKENAVAKVGESYWWWKFRFGARRISKQRPRASQLTGSEFLSQVYSTQEEMEDAKPADIDELASMVETWVSDLRDLGSEQEDKRSNMPEGLIDGPTGELLEQRTEECEAWADELEAIDTSGDLASDDDAKDGGLQEALEEVQATSYNGE